MRRHGPVIAHCTDSEDFPSAVACFNVWAVCFFSGVIYHGSRAVPGTADVVHKLKKLVQLLLLYTCSAYFMHDLDD